MIECEIRLNKIEADLKAPEGFFNNNAVIVDNEIMNDISPDWDYKKARICAVGILHKETIRVYVATKEKDEAFRKTVMTELSILSKTAEIYAFNRKMEEGNFLGDFGFEIKIKEIKPFNAKGWNKDRFYRELMERKIIPEVKITDIFDGDGGKVINAWNKYISSGYQDYLDQIIEHNINCLLKESIILKNQDMIREHFVIDDKNFMIEERWDKK